MVYPKISWKETPYKIKTSTVEVGEPPQNKQDEKTQNTFDLKNFLKEHDDIADKK